VEGAASLDELEALVAAADGEWTALSLQDDHSLAEQLRGPGVLSADAGAVVLERDEFLEGVVAGAAGVYRDAQPHLRAARAEVEVTSPPS
jgi:hypothetical protein